MIILKIESLDENFQAIAFEDNHKFIVPNSLPGDLISTQSFTSKNFTILEPSPHRITPECRHFFQCGGCSLQYIDEKYYLSFKNKILENLITAIGASKEILDPPISVNKFSRRRAIFKIMSGKIGYYKDKTNELFDISECIILEKPIFSMLEPIRNLNKKINKFSQVEITLADNGIDILFNTEKELELNEIELITKFANDSNVIRISISNKNKIYPVLIKKIPQLLLGDYQINLPEKVFLQATIESQNQIIYLIKKHLNNYKKIADLYAGIGTYSFSLAASAKIDMYEGDAEMVKAANLAVKNNNPKAYFRNLFNNPLTPKELDNYEVVIINPPRNGAERQIKHIANSKLKKIIMISCNHKTFKRDARILIENGFELTNANLIDQFLYTKHFEIFSVFCKNNLKLK